MVKKFPKYVIASYFLHEEEKDDLMWNQDHF